VFEGCDAAFPYDGTNDGMGDFTFQIMGDAGSTWKVSWSDNLSNWSEFSGTVTLEPAAGVTNSSGFGSFTDSSVSGAAQRFYQLSNSTNSCCSRVVGFETLIIEPGTNFIADQLYQVDDGPVAINPGFPMNTLYALMENWGSAQNYTELFKWNGQGFNMDQFLFVGLPLWTNGGDMTILPGDGVLMLNNSGGAFSLTFTGLVRQQQSFQITDRTNYLSPTVPMAGAITNVTSYVPHSGDVVQLWNQSSQAFVSHTYNSGSWSGGVPILGVGEGFVLITTNAYTWTNTFATGVCGP
jgi:hypothetical protein